MENRELLKATVSSKIGEEELDLSTNNARRMFGKLSLCVSIYRSVQAAYSRRFSHSAFHRLCNESFSFDEWKAIEREFGDNFHVRGELEN